MQRLTNFAKAHPKATTFLAIVGTIIVLGDGGSDTTKANPPAVTSTTQSQVAAVSTYSTSVSLQPTCTASEASRSCTGCNTAKVTSIKTDCSEEVLEIADPSCSHLCPVPKAVASQTPQAKAPSPKYACNCKKTCAQMSSCEEAQYQLNVCGCTQRDADKDGVACDSDCQ